MKNTITVVVIGVVGNLLFWGLLLYGAYRFGVYQGWLR